MAESFGIRLGVEGEKEFKNTLQNINRQFKVLQSEMNLVTSQFDKSDKSVDALTARHKVLSSTLEEQKKKIKTLESALNNAASSFGKADKRTQSWQMKLNNAKAELNKMNRELEENARELEKAGKEAEDYSASTKEVGEMSSLASDKMALAALATKNVGIAIATAVAAIASATAGAAVGLMKLGSEYDKATNQLAASTGATGAEMEKLKETVKKVYSHNFGESMEDAANGVAIVKKNTRLMGEELEKATEYAFMLRDTFDHDINESSRAAYSLMKNFGISSKEAFNIIAVGAQKGADKNGDLLDTLNEYSVQYAALGFSADQFLQTLIEGAEAGAFSVDKIGDAIKEFNIRAKDGSKATIEAFSILGMDADKMMTRFAAGGETARQAFFEVVKALESMDDPMEKNAAAVGLFGTMYEDLEQNILPVFSNLENSTKVSYDALEQINDVKYDDLESALQGLWRAVQTAFIPMASALSGSLTDIITTFLEDIELANGDIGQIGQAFGRAVQDMVMVAAEKMPELVEMLSGIAREMGKGFVENKDQVLQSVRKFIDIMTESFVELMPEMLVMGSQISFGITEGIISALPKFADAILKVVEAMNVAIGTAMPTLIPAVIEALLGVVRAIVDNLGPFIEAGGIIVAGIVQGILNSIPVLEEELPKLSESIIKVLTENLPKIVKLGMFIVSQLIVGILMALPDIFGVAKELLKAIIDMLLAIPKAAYDIGRNIVLGLAEGIASMLEGLKNDFSGAIGEIIKSIKEELGIHSPSTVFMDIGENMGLGLKKGFLSSMKNIQEVMQDAVPTELDTNIKANMGYAGGGDFSSAPGAANINNEITVNMDAKIYEKVDMDQVADKVAGMILQKIKMNRYAY